MNGMEKTKKLKAAPSVQKEQFPLVSNPVLLLVPFITVIALIWVKAAFTHDFVPFMLLPLLAFFVLGSVALNRLMQSPVIERMSPAFLTSELREHLSVSFVFWIFLILTLIECGGCDLSDAFVLLVFVILGFLLLRLKSWFRR